MRSKPRSERSCGAQGGTVGVTLQVPSDLDVISKGGYHCRLVISSTRTISSQPIPVYMIRGICSATASLPRQRWETF